MIRIVSFVSSGVEKGVDNSRLQVTEAVQYYGGVASVLQGDRISIVEE